MSEEVEVEEVDGAAVVTVLETTVGTVVAVDLAPHLEKTLGVAGQEADSMVVPETGTMTDLGGVTVDLVVVAGTTSHQAATPGGKVKKTSVPLAVPSIFSFFFVFRESYFPTKLLIWWSLSET